MINETIEKHGVVVEYKGFKIGDEVFVSVLDKKGIVTWLDKNIQVNFDDSVEIFSYDNIEHLADYELRTKREEFERKFKGKKIRLENWKKIKYVIFDNWHEGLFFNFIDDAGNVGMWSADDNWQILEEPEVENWEFYQDEEEPHSLDDLKVGDVIENEDFEFSVVLKAKEDNTFKLGQNTNWYSIEDLKQKGYKKKEQSE